MKQDLIDEEQWGMFSPDHNSSIHKQGLDLLEQFFGSPEPQTSPSQTALKAHILHPASAGLELITKASLTNDRLDIEMTNAKQEDERQEKTPFDLLTPHTPSEMAVSSLHTLPTYSTAVSHPVSSYEPWERIDAVSDAHLKLQEAIGATEVQPDLGGYMASTNASPSNKHQAPTPVSANSGLFQLGPRLLHPNDDFERFTITVDPAPILEAAPTSPQVHVDTDTTATDNQQIRSLRSMVVPKEFSHDQRPADSDPSKVTAMGNAKLHASHDLSEVRVSAQSNSVLFKPALLHHSATARSPTTFELIWRGLPKELSLPMESQHKQQEEAEAEATNATQDTKREESYSEFNAKKESNSKKRKPEPSRTYTTRAKRRAIEPDLDSEVERAPNDISAAAEKTIEDFMHEATSEPDEAEIKHAVPEQQTEHEDGAEHKHTADDREAVQAAKKGQTGKRRAVGKQEFKQLTQLNPDSSFDRGVMIAEENAPRKTRAQLATEKKAVEARPRAVKRGVKSRRKK